jgi:hypothetical protein
MAVTVTPVPNTGLRRQSNSAVPDRGDNFVLAGAVLDYNGTTLTLSGGRVTLLGTSQDVVYSVEFDDRQFVPGSDGELFVSVTDSDPTDAVAQASIVGPDSPVPAAPKLKLGSVDVSAGTVTQVNRQPELVAQSVTSPQVATDEIGDAGTGTVSFRGRTEGLVQGCRVFLSSDQSIQQASPTQIDFDSEVYDNGNNFDTSANSWTCPETGVYMANLQINFQGGTTSDERKLFIGSAGDVTPTGQGSFSQFNNSGQGRFQTTTINKYTAGDTIAFFGSNADSSDSLSSGEDSVRTFAEVALIGGL